MMSATDKLPAGYTRRAVWRTEEPGDLKRLRLQTDTLPPPAAGEVRVAIQAVGLNFADVFTALGMYDAAPQGEPVIPGLEFAGVVEEVGERLRTKQKKVDVERSADGRKYVVKQQQGQQDKQGDEDGLPTRDLRPGDRVMGFTRFGAYSTHVNVGTPFIRRIPDEWSYAQGAGFVVQALTAWYGAMQLGAAPRARSMLVHSAAGGVGLFSLQICQMFGVVPVAIVGSEDKARFLQDTMGLKASQIIVRPYREKEFRRRLEESLRAIGCEGFDIVMDSVAGKYFQAGYDNLAPGGRHILFGAATYTPRGDKGKVWTSPEFWYSIVPKFLSRPTLDVQNMIGENKSVAGFNLIWLTDGKSDPKELGRLINEILQPSVRWMPPIIGKTFPFTEVLEALRYFKSGKVVLTVSEDDADKGSAQ